MANVSDRAIEVISVLFSLVGVAANALNLVTLWSNDCKAIFRRSVHYMVTCLALADLLTTAVSLIYNLRNLTEFYHKTIVLAINYSTFLASFVVVVALAVDRFFAVIRPMDSEAIVSPRRTLIGCVLIWIFCPAMSVFILVYDRVGQFVFLLLIDLCIIAMMVMYAMIYRKARTISSLAHRDPVGNKDTIRKATLESRVFTVVLILVVMVVVTVLPYTIARLVYHTLFITGRTPNADLRAFLEWYYPVETLNFILNPFVYAWRLPKYRKALFKTLKCG